MQLPNTDAFSADLVVVGSFTSSGGILASSKCGHFRYKKWFGKQKFILSAYRNTLTVHGKKPLFENG